jgi:hypothetical protein
MSSVGLSSGLQMDQNKNRFRHRRTTAKCKQTMMRGLAKQYLPINHLHSSDSSQTRFKPEFQMVLSQLCTATAITISIVFLPVLPFSIMLHEDKVLVDVLSTLCYLGLIGLGACIKGWVGLLQMSGASGQWWYPTL